MFLRLISIIFFLSLNSSLIAQNVNSSSNFFIYAETPHWGSTFASLAIEGETVHEDSVLDGTFKFNGQVKGVKEGTLIIKKGNLTATIPVFIEPGVIKINEGENTTYEQFSDLWLITGTKHNDLFYAFRKHVDSLYPLYYFNEEKRARVNDYAKKYIEKNKNLIISLEIYRSLILSSQLSDSIKLSVFNSLPQYLRKTFGGRNIQRRLNQLINTSIGKKAPLFKQIDTAGHLVTLQTFQKKFVLIDFWASWCGPCREENPTIRKMFDSYKTKGFTVVSVSLDYDKQLWLKAIQKDRLSWTHVSDLKGWNNSVAKLYWIEAIPANFLVNPDGVIIGKNLIGKTLEDKLSSIFK